MHAVQSIIALLMSGRVEWRQVFTRAVIDSERTTDIDELVMLDLLYSWIKTDQVVQSVIVDLCDVAMQRL